jgi:alanyl aminopeptidase
MSRRPTPLPIAALVLAAACGPAAGTDARRVAAPRVGASHVPSAEAPALPAPTTVRLPEHEVARSYWLDLDVDPRKDRFEGRVELRLDLEQASPWLVLHGRDLDVRSARIVADGSPPMDARVLPRHALGAKDAMEELVLVPPAPLRRGPTTVEIVYSAPFNRQLRGLYKLEEGGKPFAFTQLEAVDARRMFPCLDEPHHKTPFELRVRVPKGMIAISNAPEARRTETGDHVVFEFHRTEPLPTYLVALAVGELEIRQGPTVDGVPLRLVTTPGKTKLGDLSLPVTGDVLRVLSRYFGRPYPYKKLDIVAVPDFGPGAMENAGLVTFREEFLLFDAKRTAAATRRRFVSIAAHELAHQWFGNLVTMEWWDDLWLNEGFATWMAAKAGDMLDAKLELGNDLVGGKLGAMQADALPSARPVRVPIPTTDAILESGGWSAYQKGGSILSMLEHHAGEDSFRAGIRAYLEKHAFGAVTSDDFLAAMAGATKGNLASIGKTFLDQPGVPLVSVRVECAGGTGTAHLVQSPLELLPREGAPRRWTIPVCLRVEGRAAPVCSTLEGERADVPLPACPRWVHPNADEAGYYRFALDAPSLRALAAARGSLSDRERMALPSHAWTMVQAGRMTPDVLFDLLAALAADRSREVVEQVIGVLYPVRDALVDDAHLPAFRAWVSRLFAARAKALGMDPRPGEPDETRLLRLDLLGALLELAEDRWVLEEGDRRARAWLDDPERVHPDLEALVLRASARKGGAADEETLVARIAATPSPLDRVALVGALAASRDRAVQERAVARVADGTLRASDARYVFRAAGFSDVRRTFLYAAMAHADALAKRLPGVGGLAGSVGWTCGSEETERVRAFWGARVGRTEGAQRPFDEGIATATLCARVRERDLARASAWLEKAR